MSTLSNGGPTWSTKLNRIKARASEDVASVFDNIGHVIDEEFLLDCFNRLDGKKAVGIDGITKENYEGDLSANLTELLIRIRRGTYRPQPARIVEIPKEDGSMRPLAICCFEDKIVQLAVHRLMESIFDPEFLPCSHGYRLGKSSHGALKSLLESMNGHVIGAVVEIDLRAYFNSIPHSPLLEILRGRIRDNRFLGLVMKLLKMPCLYDDGKRVENDLGVPQGSILSPLLSNIYLHHVIDRWFLSLSKTYFKGNCQEIRFADDLVFVFGYRNEAEAFKRTLPKRLAKFGLELNEAKSSLQPSGSRVVQRIAKEGEQLPKFKFLGFEVSWKPSRSGRFRPFVRPRLDRMVERLRAIRSYLFKNRTHPNHMVVLRDVARVMVGWINYFAVSDSSPRVKKFIDAVRIMVHRWFNRRGRRNCMNWSTLDPVLDRAGLPNKFHLVRLYQSAGRLQSEPSGA